jgi:hypothetical protein
MTPRIDPSTSLRIPRRSFLALGFGALAWACAKGTPGSDPSAEPGDTAFSVIATAKLGLAIGDTRQAFAVFRGQRPVAVEGLKVALKPPTGRAFEVTAQHVKTERGPGGDGHDHAENTEVADIYVVRHDFDTPGVWEAALIFDDGRGNEVFQILEESPSPMVGQKAIASQSPTTDDHRGVDPICTRDPVCSMHDITIADALDSGKPTVIIFGTPRYCESRTCGPVVDYVEAAKDKVGDDASFVHVEVWKNDEVVGQPKGDAPAFAEWKLGTEPWIYFIGSDGKVRDRWLGAAGPNEIRKAVDALVST